MSMTIRIKKMHPEAILPKFAHQHDAGMDLYAAERTIIKAGERKLLSTGLAMAIPVGYVGLIWDRSGMANNYGLKSLGGVVDSGYRGEVKIGLHNLSNNDFVVEKGMKIAQMLIQPVERREIIEVEELDMDTSRGKGGFGSSGLR